MAPEKKVIGLIKLQIQTGSANPASPTDPALSQHGMDIMGFRKAYNAQTESMRGSIAPVEIIIYEDHSFNFVLKTSPASEVIRKAAGIQKDSGTPNIVKVANLTWDQVAKTVEEEMKDLNTSDIEAAKKIIMDTARSTSVTVD